MSNSLCETCAHLREVMSGRGSRFLLCLLSRTDGRYPKYPPQPVLRCSGYEPRREADAGGTPDGADRPPADEVSE
jgi:hypothetical protein